MFEDKAIDRIKVRVMQSKQTGRGFRRKQPINDINFIQSHLSDECIPYHSFYKQATQSLEQLPTCTRRLEGISRTHSFLELYISRQGHDKWRSETQVVGG